MSRKYKFQNPEGLYFMTFATVCDCTTTTWQDDNTDPNAPDNNSNLSSNQSVLDNSLLGYFYVNDPDNKSYAGPQSSSDGPFPFHHDNKLAYNDLERRKNDLCNFLLNGNSGGGHIFPVVFALSQLPIAE